MAAAQDQAGQWPGVQTQSPSPVKIIGGSVLMALGVALTSYGAHFLIKTGTCSGTGYVSYGPVARCPGAEPLYITSAFFIGPLTAIIGWALARASGWLWPTFCLGVGAGLVTIATDPTANPGAKAFGLATGICLFALAVLSITVRLRKQRRPRNSV